jgi:hypothetical protein
MQTNKPRVRQIDLLSEELQGERVVYDNSNNKVHRMNATMSWLWNRCDGSRTIDDLISAMQSDTGHGDARDLIIEGLHQLADANLLEPGSVDLNTLGSARNMVSRRVAVAAGVSIAVPILTSILAPTPASAKSQPEKDNKDSEGNNNGKKTK